MKYYRKILANGLRILTIPMPSFESATVLVMVAGGSRYETKLNNGISHFLEHMAFKGTGNRPTAIEISTLIDGIGGEVNAFTGKETTGYYIKSSSNHIKLSMDVLSDMLKNSLFNQSEIDKERGVIIEEINLYEDTPVRKLNDVYERLLYGDTPMGWDIGGERGNIKKIIRNNFLSYLKSLYSAHNMTVVVAGGVSSDTVLPLVEHYFSDMPKFKTIPFKKVIENQKEPKVLIKKKKTEQVHIAIGVRTVDINHKDKYALAILSAILGGGMSSRLFHEVREKRGLAYYIRSSSDHYQDCGTLVSSAGIDPKRIDDAILVIVQEYGKLSSGKIEAEEVKKAKEFTKGHFVLELEDSRSVAAFYATQELLEEKIDNPEDVLVQIDKITLKDVREVAKKYFVPGHLNLAIIGNFEDKERFKKLLG